MRKYFAVFYLSAIQTLKNPKALIGLSAFLITCLIIFAHLWKVAAAKTGAFSFHPDQLLWYIAFNEWVLVALPDVNEEMEHDVRSGRLAYLLPRPMSYLGDVFFTGLGSLCINLVVLGLVTFSFAWIRVGHMPFTWGAFCYTLILGLLAGCVGILFKMLIGLSAFWLHHTDPLHWIWEKLLFTLGGLMLPLTIYPHWLQKIAAFTPFPAILGGRSALAIDFTLTQALSVSTLLCTWGLVALLSLLMIYRRGLSNIHLGGG